MKEVTKYEYLAPNSHIHLEREVKMALSNSGKNKSISDLLFFYCEYETAKKIGNTNQLMVSGGAPEADLKKKKIKYQGRFPVGLYATDIPPWKDTGVSSDEMRQAFYSTAYGLTKSIDYFVAFLPSPGWKKVGKLEFPSTSWIQHWCLEGGKKGDLVQIDGIAYGKSLIDCLPFKYHWF